jgi:hypothetical protein
VLAKLNTNEFSASSCAVATSAALGAACAASCRPGAGTRSRRAHACLHAPQHSPQSLVWGCARAAPCTRCGPSDCCTMLQRQRGGWARADWLTAPRAALPNERTEGCAPCVQGPQACRAAGEKLTGGGARLQAGAQQREELGRRGRLAAGHKQARVVDRRGVEAARDRVGQALCAHLRGGMASCDTDNQGHRGKQHL